jgi:glycerol kinase
MAFGTHELLAAMLAGPGLRVPALRVDGGASANNWLMQFQADILGVPVERPALVETTGLGAALLAGMATGVWSTPESLLGAIVWDRFDPRLGESDRERLLAGWARAIRSALSWARETEV